MAKNLGDDNTIKGELENSFPAFSVMGPIKGTYGEVWILSRDGKIAQAIKVIKPNEKIGSSEEELSVFEREMALSLKIPPNINVISIYGFVVPRVRYVDGDSEEVKFVPALRMKAMQGSLEEWTTNPDAASLENRLIALVQALSGLNHLYRHGFEGHGDIKPSNFLYTDFRSDFPVIGENDSAHWPSNKHPYRVVVSDFGWSDAWVDLGEYKKVFRQYMAPERLDGVFHPQKSDVFSMGVLLAELLLFRHPARNYKKATKSEGNWRRCCEDADWDLSGIDSDRVKTLILRSLNASAESRPTVEELIDELCSELETHGVPDLAGSIKLFETHVYGDEPERQLAWAAYQIADLNDVEKERARTELAEAADRINLTSILGFSQWLPLAVAILKIEDADSATVKEAQEIAQDALISHMSKKAHEDLSKEDFNADLNYLRPFEAFSTLASGLREISGWTAAEALQKSNLSDLVKSALAFREAGDNRYADIQRTFFYLDECERLTPNEATPHYFRARWGHEHALMGKAHYSSGRRDVFALEVEDSWISAARRAQELDPTWWEPKKLLNQWKA
jgi:serine/threonine protein kinase